MTLFSRRLFIKLLGSSMVLPLLPKRLREAAQKSREKEGTKNNSGGWQIGRDDCDGDGWQIGKAECDDDTGWDMGQGFWGQLKSYITFIKKDQE